MELAELLTLGRQTLHDDVARVKAARQRAIQDENDSLERLLSVSTRVALGLRQTVLVDSVWAWRGVCRIGDRALTVTLHPPAYHATCALFFEDARVTWLVDAAPAANDLLLARALAEWVERKATEGDHGSES